MAAVTVAIERRVQDALLSLGRFGEVRSAYVFGSQADGRADEWSDVDIAVFMDGVEDWDYDRVVRAVMHVQNEVGYDIETHLFPTSRLHNPEPGGFIHHVLGHGVKIFGDTP